MVEPVTTVLTGIALVTKSVEFIKSNIQTAQDIGQFVGAIDDAFKGEKDCNSLCYHLSSLHRFVCEISQPFRSWVIR